MRSRAFVRSMLWATLLVGLSLPARAVTINKISVDWPEELVGFQQGVLPAQLIVVGADVGKQLIWRGPDESGEDARLIFRRASLPLTVSLDAEGRSAPFVVGSIEFDNFPTTTKGPFDFVLELTLRFSDLLVQPTLQIPLRLNHTNDDVLDIADCVAPGSVTKCDDVLMLKGDAPVLVEDGAFQVTVLGFQGLQLTPPTNTVETSFLAPENQIGPRIDLFMQIEAVPEPTMPVVLGLAGIWMARRRVRRRQTEGANRVEPRDGTAS